MKPPRLWRKSESWVRMMNVIPFVHLRQRNWGYRKLRQVFGPFSWPANKCGAVLIGHLHKDRLHWGVWVTFQIYPHQLFLHSSIYKLVLTIHAISLHFSNGILNAVYLLKGDNKCQFYIGEVLPSHPAAVQQQREARSVSGRKAKRWGHPPCLHNLVSHSSALTKGLHWAQGDFSSS